MGIYPLNCTWNRSWSPKLTEVGLRLKRSKRTWNIHTFSEWYEFQYTWIYSIKLKLINVKEYVDAYLLFGRNLTFLTNLFLLKCNPLYYNMHTILRTFSSVWIYQLQCIQNCPTFRCFNWKILCILTITPFLKFLQYQCKYMEVHENVHGSS